MSQMHSFNCINITSWKNSFAWMIQLNKGRKFEITTHVIQKINKENQLAKTYRVFDT